MICDVLDGGEKMLTNYVTCHLFIFATVREKEKVWGRRRKQKIKQGKRTGAEKKERGIIYSVWCRRRRRPTEWGTVLLDVWVIIDAISLDQILMHESKYPPAIF